MADRDQILAEFQAFTGIDDFEHSLAVLEQHDWNLMEAVQNTMAGMDSPEEPVIPPDIDPPPAYSQVTHTYEPPVVTAHSSNIDTGFQRLSDGVIGRSLIRENVFQSDSSADGDAGGEGAAGATAAMPFFSNSASSIGYSSFPSTSSDSGFQPIRLITFKIEHRDRTLNVVVPDNEKVVKLKELIKIETQLPVEKQNLHGWVTKNDSLIKDDDVIRDLKLPKENTLYLIAPELPNRGAANGDDLEVAERLSQNFQLIIKHKETGKTYTLNFSGVKTVREVKSDIYALIDVPARHQVWSGWPSRSENDDTMTLAGSGISYPCHNLEVTSGNNHVENMSGIVDISSDEEFEDAQYGIDEEVLFDTDVPISKKQTPLMPENATNQCEALESFVREFSVRYGDNHPVFYIGTLEDALKDSLQCRARERKLLAVYLHHDNSIQANVFCSQILCSDAVIGYLSTHFVLWGWDLTIERNRAKLLTMCTKHFGSVAANTVRNFKPDELPLLLIISRNRLSNEVVQVIRGNTSVDELVPQLMNCVEVFHHQQTADIREEDERYAREEIKKEQEQAYEQSLIADRAKAECKKKVEEEQRRIEEEHLETVKKEDEQRRHEEMQKEAIRRSVADQLPDEPPEGCSEPVSTIRFRCPGGEVIVRRFLAQHPLQVLLNFVTSKGYHIEEHKVLTTFPRKDLTQLDSQKTLKELNLFPQETLMLEEK